MTDERQTRRELTIHLADLLEAQEQSKNPAYFVTLISKHRRKLRTLARKTKIHLHQEVNRPLLLTDDEEMV